MDTSARSGILLVDKPAGPTSHDVVAMVRKRAATRRVGHAGTLDPMATGLLILGVNAATRLLTYVVGLDKEYEATVRLGASTPTDDADSELDERAASQALAAITEEVILEEVRGLTGDIQQVPSSVSAIKVDGKRAYARVRAGEKVELKSRAVRVESFDVLAIRHAEFIDVDVRVECSTGTYVRALARDLGLELGVGGHLTSLRRTRVGPFRVSRASNLDDLDVAADLMAVEEAARELFPVIEVSAQAAEDLGHGKRVDVARAVQSLPHERMSEPMAALAPDGRLVGLVRIEKTIAKSIINFPREGEGS